MAYIQTLSATPPSRPRRHRRRISSCPSLFSCSLLMDAPALLPMPFVGDALSDRCRTRSYRACRRELVGV